VSFRWFAAQVSTIQIYFRSKGGRGEKPLPYSLYQKRCSWLIEQGNKESIFARSFLTLTWNLMCRSKNTTNIHHSHISWEDDCLTIQFANPEKSTICPILSLSVYLSTIPSSNEGKLFGGANQYERFRKSSMR